MVSRTAFRDRRQRVTWDSLLGASHSYGSFRRNEKPGHSGPRERGGARPARQSAQGAAAALALAPGQAGPSGARRQGLMIPKCRASDSRCGAPNLVLSGEVSPRRVGIGGSGRFLVNEVRGWFLSDEPLTLNYFLVAKIIRFRAPFTNWGSGGAMRPTPPRAYRVFQKLYVSPSH
jgi:hypothetical protein